MKAIVLTYDRYHVFTDHMLHSYSDVWPENPFTFLVPYQSYPNDLKDKYGEKVKLVNSKPAIKATVLNLLEGLDDEEWIYWSIDDKYPIDIEIQKVSEIYNWLEAGFDTDISAVMFCVKSNMLKPKRIDRKDFINVPTSDIKMYRRKNYDYIWMHQFLKVKVIKHFFLKLPNEIREAKMMDYLLKGLNLPSSHKLYTLSKSIALFGESTHRGKITANCAESIKNKGWELPNNFELAEKKILMGRKAYDENKLVWHLRNLKDFLIGK